MSLRVLALVLEKTFSSLCEKTPVEKDFPRSGVTPPPSLRRRGSQLGAPDTCPPLAPPLVVASR